MFRKCLFKFYCFFITMYIRFNNTFHPTLQLSLLAIGLVYLGHYHSLPIVYFNIHIMGKYHNSQYKQKLVER